MPEQAGTSFWSSLYSFCGTCLYPLAVVLSWGASLWARLKKGRESSFRERLGLYPATGIAPLASGRVVWVHAASAGEVNAITPLCRRLKKARPKVRIVITTTSRTGRRAAQESKAADAAFLAPLDMPTPVRRAFRAFRPALLLVAETELWPVLFRRAAHNNVPPVLVNGRLSDRNFPKYRSFAFLFRDAVGRLASCLMQTGTDAERIILLGAAEKRIRVAGQMKYDVNPPDPGAVETFRNALGLKAQDLLFTMGSIRDGEEEELLKAAGGLLALSDRVRVLMAPRHLKNVPSYGAKLGAQGYSWMLRSAVKTGSSWRVLVLDTFGELAAAYALSRGAFVGGTLVPVGGHNLVEPALSKVPPCFGPYTSNVREAAEALTASGGGMQVKDAAGLVSCFKTWMDDRAFQEAGQKAYEAVGSMRGATEKTLAEVLRFLPE